MKPEISLTVEPGAQGVLQLTLQNVGPFTSPPFGFTALFRAADGLGRPTRFETGYDMKPGERFRFELPVRADEMLTIRFDAAVELVFRDETVADNLLTFPPT